MRQVWLAGVLAFCGAATAMGQDLAKPAPATASAFSTSLNPGDASSVFSELRAPALTSEAAAFAPHRMAEAKAFADPAPAEPEPRFVFGARDDYRWQLGLGISLVRFRSSRFYATGVGTSTSLAYFTNEWFAVQGEVTTAFAPTIYQNEHVKYVGYAAGPMVAWREKKIEPWIHALFGGLHVQPQTANTGRNAFGVQLGGGVDYRFYPHLSARVELDWVRSHFFSQWQNSAEAALELVLHF